MTLKLHIPENRELKPRLTVFGVGGAGGNAVNNMISRSLEGVDFVVANTDAQALSLNDATYKIQLGEELTEGLGAGAKPEVGAGAAVESLERIVDVLKGSHMCFITAGMGGGTGTGAAPVIAQAARELGILTVGVVTKPFTFEGARRMKLADEGIKELQQYVDTLIIIPNQNLFLLANENTTFSEAFGMADDVLYQGVKGVTDLMVLPGMVNLDFADIRSVMDEMGKAMMGTGEAEGEDRAVIAAERAIDNPLLDEVSLRGARGVLINITGGEDMSLFEVDEASNKIREQVDPDANIIFGSTLDESMTGRIRVSVVATGIDAGEQPMAKPLPSRRTNSVAEADLFSRTAEETQPAPSVEDSSFDERSVEEAPVETAEYAEETTAHAYQEAPAFEEEQEDVAQAHEDVAASAETHADEFEPRFEPQADFEQEVAPAPEAPRHNIALERMQRAAQAQPAQAQSLRPEPAPEAPTERKRFGLDSVFRRMTGGEEQAPTSNFNQMNAKSAATAAPERKAVDLNQEERERVDIPAFLRRQAN